jgi:hypothetical protein
MAITVEMVAYKIETPFKCITFLVVEPHFFKEKIDQMTSGAATKIETINSSSLKR